MKQIAGWLRSLRTRKIARTEKMLRSMCCGCRKKGMMVCRVKGWNFFRKVLEKVERCVASVMEWVNSWTVKLLGEEKLEFWIPNVALGFFPFLLSPSLGAPPFVPPFPFHMTSRFFSERLITLKCGIGASSHSPQVGGQS